MERSTHPTVARSPAMPAGAWENDPGWYAQPTSAHTTSAILMSRRQAILRPTVIPASCDHSGARTRGIATTERRDVTTLRARAQARHAERPQEIRARSVLISFAQDEADPSIDRPGGLVVAPVD